MDVKTARTPDLVRKFAECHVIGWNKNTATRKNHDLLGRVVVELRNRGVLD